jgi:hypothetical protein
MKDPRWGDWVDACIKYGGAEYIAEHLLSIPYVMDYCPGWAGRVDACIKNGAADYVTDNVFSIPGAKEKYDKYLEEKKK